MNTGGEENLLNSLLVHLLSRRRPLVLLPAAAARIMMHVSSVSTGDESQQERGK